MTPPHVDAALEFLTRNYQDSALRLKHVAEATRVSPAYLDRLLTRETGASFLVHLHRVRLIEACKLLDYTQLSVKEISFSVGYKYVVEFDRHFKRIHGVTPSEWRHRNNRLVSAATRTVNR